MPEEAKFEKVEINGETLRCRRIMDILKEYAKALETADSYRKKVIVSARQATEREEIYTSQDGRKNWAEPGDWIIHNPGDKDPYVFGSRKDSVEERQRKFASKYTAVSGSPGQFRARGVIRAIRVNVNIIFQTPSSGQDMVIKAGGWVTESGSGIAEESFANTYEKIDQEPEESA